MKAISIVRRVDDLIREGDPPLTTLTSIDRFCMAIHSVVHFATGLDVAE